MTKFRQTGKEKFPDRDPDAVRAPARERHAAVDELAVKEDALVRSALGGDAGAFGDLVRMHQERAIRIAAGLTNFEEARDLAQEAFVKAYENLSRFKAQSRFFTWFYRILVNVCRDHLRKKMRTTQIFVRAAEPEDPDQMRAEPADARTPDARQNLLSRELGGKIREGLETLPFRQKTAFTLRYLDGLSLELIAQTMGLSVGAVKAHLWQAGEKMRRHLGAYLRA